MSGFIRLRRPTHSDTFSDLIIKGMGLARAKFKATLGMAVLAGLSVLVLLSGRVKQFALSAGSITASMRPIGSAQLVSTESFPDPATVAEGEMCEFVPASATNSLTEILRAEDSPVKGSSTDVDRAPVRTIRDSYPTYSAVGGGCQHERSLSSR